ncbi:aconitate hydratase [Apiospora hydei]|uniref:Large ribosomal subunit protein bL21m n=1 Tax=Apiospora hydei TaxID=1337664 RepID=A0ABR1X108_9PEZI
MTASSLNLAASRSIQTARPFPIHNTTPEEFANTSKCHSTFEHTCKPYRGRIPGDRVPVPNPQAAEALYPRIPQQVNPPTSESQATIAQLLPLLRTQPAHYLTAHIWGRPYLVTAGDQIRLPFKMPGVVPGDVLRLDRASTLGSRDFTLKGSPYIDERLFECRATVLGTETEPMRIKIKTKRRQRRNKQVRSKHHFTILRISEVSINGPEAVGL